MKDHPTDAVFRIYLGDRALARGDWNQAEGHYQAVEKLQPENSIALNNLAWISHKLGRTNALSLAEKANAISPGQPAFMDTLATILSDSGQTNQALELEKKAIEISPDYHIARLNLAKLYLKTGDKSQARRELELLSKAGEKFSNHAEVAQLLKGI
jgi:tetratricopeptide (TPR) repeat protein